MQVYQDVDERVVMSNGTTIAELGTLNAKIDCLTVDPLGCGPLAIDILVLWAVTIHLMTEPRAITGRQGGGTALFGPVFMCDRASLPRGFGKA